MGVILAVVVRVCVRVMWCVFAIVPLRGPARRATLVGVTRDPALTGWAKLCRAFGAGFASMRKAYSQIQLASLAPALHGS